MVPVECVARGYLTGSGLAEYQQTRTVVRARAARGARSTAPSCPAPIFTPATKAAVGEHDENVCYEEVARQVGAETAAQLRQPTLAVYGRARDIARERGIILADTKFEFGLDDDGQLVLADEVLTPDSSRFWPADPWQPGRAQPSFDKQYVRDWLTSPGLRLGPARRAAAAGAARTRSSSRPGPSTSRRTSSSPATPSSESLGPALPGERPLPGGKPGRTTPESLFWR